MKKSPATKKQPRAATAVLTKRDLAAATGGHDGTIHGEHIVQNGTLISD